MPRGIAWLHLLTSAHGVTKSDQGTSETTMAEPTPRDLQTAVHYKIIINIMALNNHIYLVQFF